jgi:hydroxymethylpyrimidine pyrophosphatase-like HAD family hydrolase
VRWYRAVALDLDGTLTLGGWPSPVVLDAIATARRQGLRVLLVTGRILADLQLDFPGLADRFDLVVAENGAVLRGPDWTRLLAEPVPAAVLRRLHEAGVRVRQGQVLLACDAAADHIALDAVESLGLDVALVRNRGALMLIPAGVTKGTGLREALAELGTSPHNTVAVGDAENDHAMLAAAGLGVAVANAVDALRAVADLVLTLPDGAGVADLLAGPVLAGEQRIHPARRRIVLGTTSAGEPVALPSAQTNLLITGESESGKSYLAGLVIEQLAAQGYTVLVVDPEGDHVPLGVLRAVTVVSGEQLPDPVEVPALYVQGQTSIVLDLSRLDPTGREHYLRELWPAVADQRAQTGLPHWLVLEEAQNLHWCRTTDNGHRDGFGQWGLCLVSYRPEQIAPELLTRMEWRVHLSTGGRSALLTPPQGAPYPLRLGRRATRHVRHWHKYVDSPLPEQRRFFFHPTDHSPAPVAANLREFVTALSTVPDEVIAFHAGRGDFSRWLGGVYRDHVLASLVATTEHDLLAHHDPDRTRRLLTELLTYQYLPAV